MSKKRAIIIVIDSMGIGPMPDSEKYGDSGVDTLGHIAEKQTSFKIPNLQKMGIANLKKLVGVPPVEKPLGYQMVMKEQSVGKDTMTGHWEMMGLYITKPFKTFTDTGFPQELLDELSKKTGHKIVNEFLFQETLGRGAYSKVKKCINTKTNLSLNQIGLETISSFSHFSLNNERETPEAILSK